MPKQWLNRINLREAMGALNQVRERAGFEEPLTAQAKQSLWSFTTRTEN